jgi:hypothetical protein
MDIYTLNKSLTGYHNGYIHIEKSYTWYFDGYIHIKQIIDMASDSETQTRTYLISRELRYPTILRLFFKHKH